MPDRPDALHLHDVALMPPARARGLVVALLPLLGRLGLAHGLATISLVAAHGTAPMWRRHGFRPIEAPRALDQYGADAVLMVRS